MTLLKVIMTSATVATTLFTGVASDAPAVDFTTGQFAMAPEDKVLAADAEIYDAICAALTESFDSGEPALARHFWTADVLAGKNDGTAPERMLLVKKQDSQEKAVAAAGNEIKTAGIDNSRVQGSNANAGTAVNNSLAVNNSSVVNNSPAETASGTAGQANEPAMLSNTDALADTSGSKEAAPAVNTGNVSEDTGSNAPAPAPAPAPSVPSGNPVVADNSNTPAPAPAPAVPANDPANAGSSEETAPAQVASADNGPKYDHTTSIYTNDESTLLRVEYYDENNKLFEYSSVENYNKDTNSYTETVYKWDYDNDTQVTVRTDTYENGELVSSEQP